MSSKQRAHLSVDRLSAFAVGKLPLEAIDEIEHHLSCCGPCLHTVQQTEDDAFIAFVRKAQQWVATQHKPQQCQGEATKNKAGILPSQTHSPGSICPDGAEDNSLDSVLHDHPRYRVQQLVGIGGMGTVYLAEHRLMQRPVALKIISKELVTKPLAIERFHREVRAAARLDHPNIVRAFDAEQVGDLHLLVMEYIQGTDLAEVVADRGPLPIAEACDYARQGAIGLQHAYEHGMVHRDIKPQNLMLTSEGQVKILDFGLASLTAEVTQEETQHPDAVDAIDDCSSSLTAPGALMGTPDYMAPEQASDARSADIRADIYSLGCTLYFLLTGQVPFPHGSRKEKIQAHKTGEPASIQESRPEVPGELSAVLEKMMAKAREERYQSPAEVVEQLLPFLEDVQSFPVEKTRAKKASRRWPVAAIVACTAAGLLFALYAVIYLSTPNGGTVRIKINDPKIRVSFSGNVYTFDNAGDTITIKPGLHSLEVQHGGLKFEAPKFTLGKGNNPVLSVELLNAQIILKQGDKELKKWEVPEKPSPASNRMTLVHRFKGHTGIVYDVAWFPDGKRAVAAAGNQGAWIWDMEKGKVLHKLKTSEGSICSVAVSRDGRFLVTGLRKDGRLRPLKDIPVPVLVWDLQARKVIHRLPGHFRRAREVAISPNDRLVLTGGAEGKVFLWELRTGKLLGELVEPLNPTGAVGCVAFSPDGRLAAAGRSGTIATVWDVSTRKRTHTFKVGDHGTSGLWSVQFSADNKHLVTSFFHSIWNLDSSKIVKEFGPRSRSYRMRLLPNARYALFADPDGALRLWDTVTDRQIAMVGNEDGSAIWAIALSPDGRRVLMAGGDRISHKDAGGPGRDFDLYVWQLPEIVQPKRLPKEKPLHNGSSEPLPKELPLLHRFKGHTGPVLSVAVTPDSTMAISVGEDDTVCFWDLEQRKLLLRSQDGGRNLKPCISVSADGRYAVTMGDKVVLWDLSGPKVAHSLLDNYQSELSKPWIRFSPDGKLVCLSLPKIQVFETETGKLLYGPGADYYAGAFSPDGRVMVVKKGRAVFFLQPRTGKRQCQLPDAGGYWDKPFSPDGHLLVGVTKNGNLAMWDVHNSRKLHQWDTAPRNVFSFFANNTRLLTRLPDYSLSIRDSKDGWETARMEGHRSIVAAWVLPGEKYVVSCSADGTARLWDVATGREMAQVAPPGQVTHCAMPFPNGRYLVTAGGYRADTNGKRQPTGDYDVYLWQLPQSLLDKPTSP